MATREWIDLAEKRNVGWWMTSALESNIGLNAIAQFTAEFPLDMPQGLGTGQLYNNNFTSPLFISHGFLNSSQANVNYIKRVNGSFSTRSTLQSLSTVGSTVPSPRLP